MPLHGLCADLRAAVAISRYGSPTADPINRERDDITARLRAMNDGGRVVTGPADNRSILPADVDDFCRLPFGASRRDDRAGATDVGLWVTKFLRPIGPAIFIGHLDELKSVTVADGFLKIGAGCELYGMPD